MMENNLCYPQLTHLEKGLPSLTRHSVLTGTSDATTDTYTGKEVQKGSEPVCKKGTMFNVCLSFFLCWGLSTLSKCSTQNHTAPTQPLLFSYPRYPSDPTKKCQVCKSANGIRITQIIDTKYVVLKPGQARCSGTHL